jgi:tricorn protease-like protein
MQIPLFRSFFTCLAALAFCLPSALAQTTERVSVDSGGSQGNSHSRYPNISSGGRFVAFESFASNLVPGDTSGFIDIFVHDRQTGQTTRVSVNSGGVQGDGGSYDPSISSDGRFVVFSSEARNIVPGDTNVKADIFVHDRQTGLTTRVSVDSGGVQGDWDSFEASVSSDGRFVAFESFASNLVRGDTNGTWDVFVHDRQTGQTMRASVDSRGIQGINGSFSPAISSDGRFVGFETSASNLVPGDTNGLEDVFVHDRQTGQTTRVSVDSGGVQGDNGSANASISSDGRFVAFASDASNLVPGDTNGLEDVFVHDRQTGQTTRVSVDSGGVQGNSGSGYPFISSDGRFVAFETSASNLVPGDTNGWSDVFVNDRQTGQTTRVSVDSRGLQGNSVSYTSSISSDGRYVAFWSSARNLVPGDTNNKADVFVHDREASGPSLALAGSCPGPILLSVQGATAHGRVAIACGATGNFTRAVPPCAGILLGVTPPVVKAILHADASGTAILNLNAGAGLCGRSVQAVDATTCTATNVIVL